MKKIFIAFVLLFTAQLFAANYKEKYIKGNIADKTQAVREASGEDGIWLSLKAMDFAVENKKILGNDRELEGLAVAAIISVPSDIFKTSSNPQISQILNDFLDLFVNFNDSSTVQVTLLTKILSISEFVDTGNFAKILDNYLSTVNIGSADSAVIKAVINTIEVIGINESFIVLYNCWNNKKYTMFYDDLEKALVNLCDKSVNEIIQITHCKDINQICKVFSLVQKNQKIPENLRCDIAGNALSESILLLENSSATPETNGLQASALQVLYDNSWTRAGNIALDYLVFAKKQFDKKEISDDAFVNVINSMVKICPIDSVAKLNGFLEEFNSHKEKGEDVSVPVVMAVIKTLGAIGNKSAFDYLLAVTYLNYPEEVLSAAREALAGLRW